MKALLRTLGMFAVVGAAVGMAGAATVDPGSSLDLKAMAAVSPCETDAMLDPNAPAGVDALADCDETAGTLSSFAEVNVPYAADASAAIQYMFDISAAEGTEGNMVGASLGYDLGWDHSLVLLNPGSATVALEVEVVDVTDATPVPMLKEGVFSTGLFCDTAGCSLQDPGSGSDTGLLPLMLKRGGIYMVTVRVMSDVVGDETTDPNTASAALNAAINALDVAIEVDTADLAEQVAANTEAIEALQEAVEALQMQVETNTEEIATLDEAVLQLQQIVVQLGEAVQQLQQDLADLGNVVANHTHTYPVSYTHLTLPTS